LGWTCSPNSTEVGHLGASVYLWQTLRFDVFRVNPPLTRYVIGLPIVLSNAKLEGDYHLDELQHRREWSFGRAFIAANTPGIVRQCLALARWSLIPFVLVGGYFGNRLARDIFGNSAAFVFLVLWCFSPLLLAWGGTICPDATAAALGIVAVFLFRRWLCQPNWKRAGIAGGCLGLLPLAKLTWIVAFPLWAAIWCFWTLSNKQTNAVGDALPRPSAGQFLFIILVGLYVLNLGYLFDGTCRPLGQYTFLSQALNGGRGGVNRASPGMGNRYAGTWLGKIPIPLPAEFVQGLDAQRYDFERGLPSYLRGEWANHGWWYYYLYASVVKMPVGTWCLILMAIYCTLFRKECVAAWRDEMLILLPLLSLLLLVSSQTGFSAHPRYILPASPFLFLAVSRVGRGLTHTTPVFASLAITFVVFSAASSLSVYPYCLSYFNELAAVLPMRADASYPKPGNGGDGEQGVFSLLKRLLTAGPRNGPRHLLGSSVDWGQDLFRLQEWCRSHPDARPMMVACWGDYLLDRPLFDSAGSPPFGPCDAHAGKSPEAAKSGPLPGWYALSVNEIYGPSRWYRYFLYFRPVVTVGYSIHIYHITLSDANRVRQELGMPVLTKATGG
jgi:hypothetical protein